jgi:hypothetical protein
MGSCEKPDGKRTLRPCCDKVRNLSAEEVFDDILKHVHMNFLGGSHRTEPVHREALHKA